MSRPPNPVRYVKNPMYAEMTQAPNGATDSGKAPTRLPAPFERECSGLRGKRSARQRAFWARILGRSHRLTGSLSNGARDPTRVAAGGGPRPKPAGPEAFFGA